MLLILLWSMQSFEVLKWSSQILSNYLNFIPKQNSRRSIGIQKYTTSIKDKIHAAWHLIKTARHAEKQKNITYNKEKFNRNQPITNMDVTVRKKYTKTFIIAVLWYLQFKYNSSSDWWIVLKCIGIIICSSKIKRTIISWK